MEELDRVNLNLNEALYNLMNRNQETVQEIGNLKRIVEFSKDSGSVKKEQYSDFSMRCAILIGKLKIRLDKDSVELIEESRRIYTELFNQTKTKQI